MGGDVDRKLDLYAPITFKATENQPTEAILILILRAAKFMRLDCGEESQRGVVRQAAIFIGGVVEFVPVEPEAREQLIDLRNAKLIDCPRFWAFFTVQPRVGDFSFGFIRGGIARI
jgi:hypothetical protein